MKRRELLTGAAAFAAASALAGCAKVTNALNDNAAIKNVLHAAEPLNHVVIGTRGNAKLYPDSAIDRDFRVNGFDTPSDSTYDGLRRDGFASYKLVVDGAVARPQTFTLPHLRALGTLAQTTRHDCVEGWSAIGKWNGVRLSVVLALAGPTNAARYVIFHCFDRSSDGDPYYESLDLHEAAHPQTLLALDLNDRPLDADHGAPVRLRVPTQLGYKSAKWVQRIEVASTFKNVGDGKGGYWEDQGYDWYAGI
jgi:DMSO/TMAO reductase YedYZ molybdopterin-dependent catalytic subunit